MVASEGCSERVGRTGAREDAGGGFCYHPLMSIFSKLTASKAFRGALTSAMIVLGGVSIVAPAMAQTGDAPVVPTPPTPQKPDNPPTLMMILFGVVILGAIFAVNVMPSKRGHQD